MASSSSVSARFPPPAGGWTAVTTHGFHGKALRGPAALGQTRRGHSDWGEGRPGAFNGPVGQRRWRVQLIHLEGSAWTRQQIPHDGDHSLRGVAVAPQQHVCAIGKEMVR
jgi:hypothetical protein